MQSDPKFLDLKKTFRSFTFPMSIAFFLWYILYVVFATYAGDIMGHTLWGHINVGMILGFLQFLTTFLITWFYVNFANKKIEPRAAEIRQVMEG